MTKEKEPKIKKWEAMAAINECGGFANACIQEDLVPMCLIAHKRDGTVMILKCDWNEWKDVYESVVIAGESSYEALEEMETEKAQSVITPSFGNNEQAQA